MFKNKKERKQEESNLRNSFLELPPQAIHLDESTIEGHCKVKAVFPLKSDTFKIILGILVILFTGGFFFFIIQQNPKFYKYFFFVICDVENCSQFLILNGDDTYQRQKKIVKKIQEKEEIGFRNRYMNYLYNSNTKTFKAVEFEIQKIKNNEILISKGLTQDQVKERRDLYGESCIDFDIQNFFKYMYYFFSQPNIFLVYFTLGIWLAQGFVMFAINMSISIILCQIFLYFFYYFSNKKIKDKARIIIDIQKLNENNEFQQIKSNQLVPGDIIQIQDNQVIPCDIIVISGESFVNESNITGESDPIPKTKLESRNDNFSFTEDSQSIIYEGSLIINSKDYINDEKMLAKGMVIRTGFATKKGQVIRQSLFLNYKLNDFLISLLKFNITMVILFVIVFFILLAFMLKDDRIPTEDIWLKLGIGIVSMAASTLVPFTNLSLLTALVRLQWKKIQGVHPQVIYNAGGIHAICFDKTGTITENKVITKGYWSKFTQKFTNASEIEQKIENKEQSKHQIYPEEDKIIQQLFAVCHSAQQNEKNLDELLGDVIDVQMYKLSNHKFEKLDSQYQSILSVSHDNSLIVEKQHVVKRFDFKSENACMSVIVFDESSQSLKLFIKGSPEKLKSLSIAQSLPSNFDEALGEYTCQGLRVLGLAYKDLDIKLEDVQDINRSDLEKDIQFLGFLVMENPLKSDSKDVFERLIFSESMLKIISGDNSLTVAHTAQELGLFKQNIPVYSLDIVKDQLQISQNSIKNQQLLDQKIFSKDDLENMFNYLNEISTVQLFSQIAMTGKAVNYLIEILNNYENSNLDKYVKIYNSLLLATKVCSRCTPELKKNIIQFLQNQGLKTAMVGDGANDCLAIQQANTGISFATADAALISSFCTSQESLNCVEKILTEGRSTLAINYEVCILFMQIAVFNLFLHMYQIFYYQKLNDLQLIVPSYYGGYILMMVFYTLSPPLQQLQKERIQYCLTSKRCIIGSIGRWIIPIITIIVINIDLKNQTFYDSVILEKYQQNLEPFGQLNTLSWYMYAFICSVSPLITYKSFPSKKPIFYNFLLTILTIGQFSFTLVIYFKDSNFIEGLQLVEFPDSYLLKLLFVYLATMILMGIWEKLIVNRFFLYDNSKDHLLKTTNQHIENKLEEINNNQKTNNRNTYQINENFQTQQSFTNQSINQQYIEQNTNQNAIELTIRKNKDQNQTESSLKEILIESL